MSNPVQPEVKTPAFGVTIGESVTGFINDKISGTLRVNEENGKIMTVAKLSAATVAAPVMTVAALGEAVVRNVLLIMVKTLNFFIPKQFTHKFDRNVLEPMRAQAFFSAVNVVASATKLVTNFLGTAKQAKFEQSIVNGLNKTYYNRVTNGITNLHINGFKGFNQTSPKMIDALDLAETKEVRQENAEKRVGDLTKLVAEGLDLANVKNIFEVDDSELRTKAESAMKAARKATTNVATEQTLAKSLNSFFASATQKVFG